MDKKFLRDYLESFEDVKQIILRIAYHTITINLDQEGSYFIIRNFENEYFYFMQYDFEKDILILDIEKTD